MLLEDSGIEAVWGGRVLCWQVQSNRANGKETHVGKPRNSEDAYYRCSLELQVSSEGLIAQARRPRNQL